MNRRDTLPVFGQNQGGSAHGASDPRREVAVFDDQAVREVTASELSHHAAQVVRSVRDGERLVVTRHGRAHAVMLSIRDSIEVLAAPLLAELAAAAAGGDADEGRPLWLPTGNRLVPFSYAERDAALVHDLIDTWPLERALVGEEIWRAELRRDIDRMMHSRGWPKPRLRGQGG